MAKRRYKCFGVWHKMSAFETMSQKIQLVSCFCLHDMIRYSNSGLLTQTKLECACLAIFESVNKGRMSPQCKCESMAVCKEIPNLSKKQCPSFTSSVCVHHM